MSETHFWSTNIYKLMLWRHGNWEKVAHTPNFFIRLHFDQLLLTSDDKVIESLNINSKIKCVYKGDVVIIIASNESKEVRKMKFQIKSNSEEFLRKLAQYFPVTNHSTKESVAATLKYQKLSEVFKQILCTNELDSTVPSLPPEYPNFVKLCLLDPSFLDVVRETQRVVHNFSKNNS